MTPQSQLEAVEVVARAMSRQLGARGNTEKVEQQRVNHDWPAFRQYALIAVEALTAHSPAASDGLREAIARLIEPDVWKRRDEDLGRRNDWDREISVGWASVTFEQWANRNPKLAESLAKADAIIALLPAGDAPDRARGRLEGLEEAAVIKLLRQLEFTEDGYSLRTPYDGDVDDDTGRSVVVGGELVATFVDSDEGEELIAAIRALSVRGDT